MLCALCYVKPQEPVYPIPTDEPKSYVIGNATYVILVTLNSSSGLQRRSLSIVAED